MYAYIYIYTYKVELHTGTLKVAVKAPLCVWAEMGTIHLTGGMTVEVSGQSDDDFDLHEFLQGDPLVN